MGAEVMKFRFSVAPGSFRHLRLRITCEPLLSRIGGCRIKPGMTEAVW